MARSINDIVRAEYNGVARAWTIKQWAAVAGVSPATIVKRLNKGWDAAAAVTSAAQDPSAVGTRVAKANPIYYGPRKEGGR